LNADLVANPDRLAASANGEQVNGDHALQFADIRGRSSALLSDTTITQFYQDATLEVSHTVHGALTQYEADEVVFSGLSAQREAISGVNIDEETMNLLKFEKSFQGASRYMNVINALADEVLRLVS
jgi:flagellar hook-associated protein 1 FlgK